MAVVRPGFLFLVCPDGQLVRNRLERLLADMPPPRGSWERHVYWGDEEPPPAFWERLTLQGLCAAPVALVVRQAQQWPAAVWKQLSRALSRPSKMSWPFFYLEGAWEKGQPKLPAHMLKLTCMSFAEKQGWVWNQEGLSEYTLKKHVSQRAGQLGLSFAPDALEQFCQSVPPDARAVESELGKLRLLCSAERERNPAQQPLVTLSMLTTAAWSPEGNVFQCIRQMESGNLDAVWRELSRGGDNDSLLFSLMGLLARELRILWQRKCAPAPARGRLQADARHPSRREQAGGGHGRGHGCGIQGKKRSAHAGPVS